MPCPVAHAADVPTRAFDYRNDPGLFHDPWGVLRDLHDAPPLFYSPELGGHWVAARREVILDILRNSELFSNHRVSVPRVDRAVGSIPHHMDPPEHALYRAGLVRMFSGSVVNALEADVRETTRRLLADFVDQGHCEFVHDFAQRLPVEIFMRLCGLPLDRREELVSWVEAYFHGKTPAEAEAAHHRSVAFLSEWLDAKLANPEAVGGHIIAALVSGRADGTPLTRDEMLSIVISLFNGGLDTVAAQMSHVMRHFAEHPEARQALVENPAKIPDAVEELLRRFSIISIGRLVTRDVEYQGVPLKKGDMVLCPIGAAGLDASAFENPMEVNFDRADRRKHCAFGSGPHMCVGAPLARLELRIMLEELLGRLPNLHITPGADIRYHTGVTVGLVSLPLSWSVTV